MRRLAVVAAILVIAAVAAVSILRLFMRDTARPAAQPTGSRAHLYRTTGFEEVDAFGGARHTYPETTAIVVDRTRCGVALTWRPLVGRMTRWELCRSKRGWILRGFAEVHTFFGRVDRRSYRCRPASLVVLATCSAGKTSETARGVLVGTEALAIGGRRVETLHLSTRTRLSGETRGTGTRELWLRSDGLPIRWRIGNESVTPSFIGDVTYREQVELELLSLD